MKIQQFSPQTHPVVVQSRKMVYLNSSDTNEKTYSGSFAADWLSTNTQFSVRGNTTNDTLGGTGVQIIRVSYLDQDFAGPYTETFNLNGTTWVDSIATNLCYLVNVEILLQGTGAAAPGYRVNSAAGGGGTAMVLLTAVTETATGVSSHWVAAGKTCYITEFGIASESVLGSNGGIVNLRMRDGNMGANVGATATLQSYLMAMGRVEGLKNAKILNYKTPIAIQGPAKIWTTFIADLVTTTNFWTFFSFYEV